MVVTVALTPGCALPGHPQASTRSSWAHQVHCAVAPRANPGDGHRRPSEVTTGQEAGQSSVDARMAKVLDPDTTRQYPPPHTHTPRASSRRMWEASRAPRSPARSAHAPVPPLQGLGMPLRATVFGSHLALCPRILRQSPPPQARRGGGGHLTLSPAALVPPIPE